MNENTLSRKPNIPREPAEIPDYEMAWLHLDNIEVVELVLNDLSSTDRERALALRLLSVLQAVKFSPIQRGLTDYTPR